MSYRYGMTVKGEVLIWLLKECHGELTQLYSENVTEAALTYGLRRILDRIGCTKLQSISNNNLSSIATSIQSLYNGDSWDSLFKAC